MNTAARCLRVLVVDDEPLIRWSIAETLGAAGHQVTEAQDAASALRALADAPSTDLVLLDFRLPGFERPGTSGRNPADRARCARSS